MISPPSTARWSNGGERKRRNSGHLNRLPRTCATRESWVTIPIVTSLSAVTIGIVTHGIRVVALLQDSHSILILDNALRTRASFSSAVVYPGRGKGKANGTLRRKP